jgi:hypothetical protein
MDFCCSVVPQGWGPVGGGSCPGPPGQCCAPVRRGGRGWRRRRWRRRRPGAAAASRSALASGASHGPVLKLVLDQGVVIRLLARPRLMLIKLVCLNLNRRHGHQADSDSEASHGPRAMPTGDWPAAGRKKKLQPIGYINVRTLFSNVCTFHEVYIAVCTVH